MQPKEPRSVALWITTQEETNVRVVRRLDQYPKHIIGHKKLVEDGSRQPLYTDTAMRLSR